MQPLSHFKKESTIGCDASICLKNVQLAGSGVEALMKKNTQVCPNLLDLASPPAKPKPNQAELQGSMHKVVGVNTTRSRIIGLTE